MKPNKQRIERLRERWRNQNHKTTPRKVSIDIPERVPVKRKVRLPKNVLSLLRIISKSYSPQKRPITSLISSCLRSTRNSEYLKLHKVTRDDSEKIDILLDEEFANLEHAEIVGRITHALIGIRAKLPESTCAS